MNYELAKELRNAGFPNIQDVQHRQGREFLTPDGRVSVYSLGEMAPTDDWFIPNLEELIEACGKQFHTLGRLEDAWWAAEPKDELFDDTVPMRVSGKTPAEAVARLWLTLQKEK